MPKREYNLNENVKIFALQYKLRSIQFHPKLLLENDNNELIII